MPLEPPVTSAVRWATSAIFLAVVVKELALHRCVRHHIGVTSSMEELIERFKTEARERFERVRSLAIDETLGDERFEAIREEAHKLKGAAGILGFAELKDRAAELEDLAKLGPDAESRLDSAVAGVGDALPS